MAGTPRAASDEGIEDGFRSAVDIGFGDAPARKVPVDRHPGNLGPEPPLPSHQHRREQGIAAGKFRNGAPGETAARRAASRRLNASALPPPTDIAASGAGQLITLPAASARGVLR